jgi:hypothetical protein
LDRRAEKLRKLEAQHKRVLTGGGGGLRASIDGSLRAAEAGGLDTAGLAEGEALFEVTGYANYALVFYNLGDNVIWLY